MHKGQAKEMLEPERRPKHSDIAFLRATPVLGANQEVTRQIFDVFERSNVKALVLEGFATGTTPTALNPHIKRIVEKNIPVFILSGNPGGAKGPQRIVYGVQRDAVIAGATPLKEVNINHLEEVLGTIQAEIDVGKTGFELSDAIVQKYGTPKLELPKGTT